MAGGLPPRGPPVAVVVIVGAIMSILDTTIVNVALETSADDLDAPLSTIQWVPTGYLLALATVIPLTGWAAERFGPQARLDDVVGAFVVTSALCGLAWSAESLIAFRVLQGLAGGMIMPIGMITLAQAAGPERMGRVMSVVGVPMLLAPVLGPVLGGAIVTEPVVALDLLREPAGRRRRAGAGARLCPAGAPRAAPRRRARAPASDWRGLALLSPGVAAIVFGSRDVATARSRSSSALLPLALGVLAVAAFVVRACGARSPLVDVGCSTGGFAAAAARSSSSAPRCSARCSCCRSTTRSRAACRR